MRLLFSIAVHECSDCVYDLIENINFFCHKPIIILHVPKNSKLKLDVSVFKNVYINNIQFHTGYADGTLTIIHMQNIRYAYDHGIYFDYFLPFASNQLFIKHGIEKYIAQYDTSRQVIIKIDDPQNIIFKRDVKMQQIINGSVLKSAPEGTFYSRLLIERILYDDVIDRYLKEIQWYYVTKLGSVIRLCYAKICKVLRRLNVPFFIPQSMAKISYATEEIFFPSVAKGVNSSNQKICYIPWHRDDLTVTVEDINHILNTKNEFYTVKRVGRSYSDKIRTHIRENLK